MFCPDCGREALDGDGFCIICGYPLDLLEKKIDQEKIDSLGWAERIVGKPRVKDELKTDDSVSSFTTGPQVSDADDEKKGLFCERCGTRIEVGVMCAACGDRLPYHADSDPFLDSSFKNLFRMIFGPRNFAVNFPYPVSGGTIQPMLYPGVIASLFILTIPLVNYGMLLRPIDNSRIVLTAVAGFILCVILVPAMVYLSAGLIHIFASIIGGKAQFRRAVRIFAAGMFWLLMFGLLHNLFRWGYFFLRPFYKMYLSDYYNPILFDIPGLDFRRIAIFSTIIILGWLFGWAYGGLYRLKWWQALILTLIIFFPFILPSWFFALILLPLKASGLL